MLTFVFFTLFYNSFYVIMWKISNSTQRKNADAPSSFDTNAAALYSVVFPSNIHTYIYFVPLSCITLNQKAQATFYPVHGKAQQVFGFTFFSY